MINQCVKLHINTFVCLFGRIWNRAASPCSMLNLKHTKKDRMILRKWLKPGDGIRTETSRTRPTVRKNQWHKATVLSVCKLQIQSLNAESDVWLLVDVSSPVNHWILYQGWRFDKIEKTSEMTFHFQAMFQFSNRRCFELVHPVEPEVLAPYLSAANYGYSV